MSDGLPDQLRPFAFHGLRLEVRGKEAAVEECPFCGAEGKMSVDVDSTRWQCFKCKMSGNGRSLLGALWDKFDACTNAERYAELAENRTLMYPDTLMHWGVVWNPMRKEWAVPGRSPEGKVTQLYRYSSVARKRRLLATPGTSHQMSGVNLLEKGKQTVYLCEGVWDAMALWELLGTVRRTEKGLSLTSSRERSLLADSGVLSVPGSSVFSEKWKGLFEGKRVVLLYDNDHPADNVPPAGLRGMERVAGILGDVAEQVLYLRWGNEGYTLDLPSGHDLRDAFAEGGQEAEGRMAVLAHLLERVGPVPEAWLRRKRGTEGTKAPLTPSSCSSYRSLTNSWRKALKWTDGLDHALAVMLSSIASVKGVDDQLWVKVVGPAACGKSTLCEALSVCQEYVLAKSTIRGFHSGYKEAGGEDCSLVSQVMGKTLVTKDGDTLLQSPNLSQILSEARDLYDGTSRTHYRNNVGKDYAGVRMTWILCGTSSLRSIDQSELGERFLDCVIMDRIDDEQEDEVLIRVANRVYGNRGRQSGEGSTVAPAMEEAMRMTGGYVRWLRENAADGLAAVEMSPECLARVAKLGKFVAHMRARPSGRQEESAEREVSYRLASQLVRLSNCLAYVLNRRDVDDEVERRVRRVAMDTSRGMTMSICGHLRQHQEEGLERMTIASLTGIQEPQVARLTRFMRAIGMLEPFTPTSMRGIRGRQRWRLTSRMRRLWDRVVGRE